MRKTLFKMKFCAKTSRRGERATVKLWRCWGVGWGGRQRAVAGMAALRTQLLLRRLMVEAEKLAQTPHGKREGLEPAGERPGWEGGLSVQA